MKILSLSERPRGRVVLQGNQQPKVDFEDAIEIFTDSLHHEQFVPVPSTADGPGLQESDHATRSLLNWFVDEQVEEEANMEAVLPQAPAHRRQGHGMLMLDNELARARLYTPHNNSITGGNYDRIT
jgi:ferritin